MDNYKYQIIAEKYGQKQIAEEGEFTREEYNTLTCNIVRSRIEECIWKGLSAVPNITSLKEALKTDKGRIFTLYLFNGDTKEKLYSAYEYPILLNRLRKEYDKTLSDDDLEAFISGVHQPVEKDYNYSESEYIEHNELSKKILPILEDEC